jgi:hypothetical protein
MCCLATKHSKLSYCGQLGYDSERLLQQLSGGAARVHIHTAVECQAHHRCKGAHTLPSRDQQQLHNTAAAAAAHTHNVKPQIAGYTADHFPCQDVDVVLHATLKPDQCVQCTMAPQVSDFLVHDSSSGLSQPGLDSKRAVPA